MTDSSMRVWVALPLFPDLLQPLREMAQVIEGPLAADDPPDALRQRLAGVDGVLVSGAQPIGADALAGNGRLRVVSNFGVGHNHLDLDALTAAGVEVYNTPDVLDETTADYAWALLLAAARRVGEAERWLRAGHWRGHHRIDEWLGVDIHGATLGVLGMGRIGQAVARRAAGFNMEVLYHNRSRLPDAVEHACAGRWVELDELLGCSDHLVVLVPYTPATRHIIGTRELALMKPGAVLVNLARGGVVDELALAQALRSRHLAAAALDVFEGEPAVRPELLALEQLVLSPHIASASAGTRRKMAGLAVEHLLAGLDPTSDARPPAALLNPKVRRRAG